MPALQMIYKNGDDCALDLRAWEKSHQVPVELRLPIVALTGVCFKSLATTRFHFFFDSRIPENACNDNFVAVPNL